MFDDSVFEEWLDKRAIEVFSKLGTNEPIKPEEMIILVLKAQANHFMHLDQDLRSEMKALRKDMDKRFASTQWLIGTGIALLAAMIAVFQFLQ